MVPQQESPDELVEAIARNLTQHQRRLLVEAIVRADPNAQVCPVTGSLDLRVINPLIRRRSPLVQEWRFSLYLTKLGEQVARYLNRTGDWEVPRFMQVKEEFEIEV